MSVHPNDLRHMVTIESYTASTGDRGQAVKTWATYATVPARIEPLQGRKLEIARQLVPTATHEVQIRYLSGLTPYMRVNYGGRILNIGNIQDVKELHFQNLLYVTEQQGGG